MVCKNVFFRGKVIVINGQFSFSFVVLKDINYIFGFGKISYYVVDLMQKIDAGGSEECFIIGGFNFDGVVDDILLIVEVYMNFIDFVVGSCVDFSFIFVV